MPNVHHVVVEKISDLAGITAAHATTMGALAKGDGGSREYAYYATGRSALNGGVGADGVDQVNGSGADDYWATVAAAPGSELPYVAGKLSDLAVAALADGQIVTTAGYRVAGAGGGNQYIYRSTGRSGITADGGFYVVTVANDGATYAVPGGSGGDDYLEAVNKTVVRPGQFGAFGDDSANDTSVLQTIATIGGSIEGTSGSTYLVDTTITFAVDGTKIDLRGSTIKMHGTWSTGTEMLEVTGDDCELNNGTLEGDVTELVSACTCTSAGRFSSNNLFITTWGNRGLYLNSCIDAQVSNFRATDCHNHASSGNAGCLTFTGSSEGAVASNVRIWDSAGKMFSSTGVNGGTYTNLVFSNPLPPVWLDGSAGFYYGQNSLNCHTTGLVTTNCYNKLSANCTQCSIVGFSMVNDSGQVLTVQGVQDTVLSDGVMETTEPTRGAIHILNHPVEGEPVYGNKLSNLLIINHDGKAMENNLDETDCYDNEFRDVHFMSASTTADDSVVTEGGLRHRYYNCTFEYTGVDSVKGFRNRSADCELHNCTIKGVLSTGILSSATGLIIDGGKITVGNTRAIHFQAGCDGSRVRDLDIVTSPTGDATGDAIWVGCPDIVFKNVHIESTDATYGYGIETLNNTCEQIKIIDCSFDVPKEAIPNFIQATNNYILGCNMLGLGVTTGVNGGTNPGAHVASGNYP